MVKSVSALGSSGVASATCGDSISIGALSCQRTSPITTIVPHLPEFTKTIMPRHRTPDKDNPNASGNTPSRSPTPPAEGSRHHNKRRREDPDNSTSSASTKRPHLPSSRLAESNRNQEEKDNALRRAREGRIRRRDEREHQASRNALLEHPSDSEEVRRLKGASPFFGHPMLHY